MPNHRHSGASSRAPPPRTSEILLEFARNLPAERVRLADLVRLLGERSFGPLLLLFALPNAIPHGVPGVSTITGIPLCLIAFQMLIGLPKVYLPRWLGERSLGATAFCRILERAASTLRKMERFMKPRWDILRGAAGERLLGGFCLVLAVVLALPIPFGNFPPGVAMSLIALGVIERDGMLVSAGMVVGIIALVAVWGVLWAMAQAAIAFVQHFLSD